MRVLCFALVVLCNVLMTNFFVKAMNLLNSRDATVINSSANFCFTVSALLLRAHCVMLR
jgi:hypothetical protein